ncbi:flagellar hook assembly protein FlgD [Dongia soli]|uniref:Basal-body rod modification protein FlgD n=1 Tax=Dongia soli TaxID=600628 RepID=A0ABU5E8F3_9PROT|nr:flagellar hook assembly protein FlgD [Dongia soli]MDY0882642.1 flagellar hook assembly protein FlgD [Dongia soli]
MTTINSTPNVADILGKNQTQTNTPSSPTDDASASLNSQYNDFLLLLTKQLQNQDPLSPLDTAQFTQQLVGFASVEQMIQQNKSLNQLINLQSSTNTYAAASFLGNTVAVDSDQISLQDGHASFQYQIEQSATQAELRITDSKGQIVLVQQANEGVGTYQVDWEGQGFAGQLPDGQYQVSVVYSDASGTMHSAPITAFGKVDSADIKGGNVSLNVGSVSYPIDKIIKIVHQDSPATTPTPPADDDTPDAPDTSNTPDEQEQKPAA